MKILCNIYCGQSKVYAVIVALFGNQNIMYSGHLNTLNFDIKVIESLKMIMIMMMKIMMKSIVTKTIVIINQKAIIHQKAKHQNIQKMN